ncbi:MAG: alpha/beta hydrolase [Armatimonadota bacterium]|nr:alpha/beta hydrolase [Armatimonadota bacterium]MCX7778393.1 alpha/beta hydrolase [Armatimonadota bacterium]MDW8026262.1 alpha/beta hydrolase [Armatimonadota bacterium]
MREGIVSKMRIRWLWLLWRVLFAILMLWFIGDILWVVLSFHPPRFAITKNPSDFGLQHEGAEFTTEDGVRIAGWFIPASKTNDTRCTVVVCHGYPGARSRFIDVLPALHRGGFSVFMFDFRGNGESGGKPTIGRMEVKDVEGAVKWLRKNKPKACFGIGIIGFSMGGAVAIMAAAQNKELKAVISDSAYASLDRPAKLTLKRTFGPLAPVLGIPAWVTFRIMLGCNPEDIAPYRVIGRISPRAVFIIHGTADHKVSVEDALLLYRSAKQPKELWIGEGVKHVRMFAVYQSEYEKRMVAFFKRYLLQKDTWIGGR